MRFDADYHERAALKDGRVVLLRLLRASDKPRLARAFSRLSEEGRYRRFLVAKPRLSSAELDYLTDVDQQTHFAIAAVLPQGQREGDGVGVARFIVSETEPGVAEAAVTVADELQGVGLGSLLFARLIEAARERGVHRFRGEVLATNQAMLAITRGVSPQSEPLVSDGVAIVDFDLPGATIKSTGDDPKESSQPLLRWFASGAAALREFLTWLPLGTDEEE